MPLAAIWETAASEWLPLFVGLTIKVSLLLFTALAAACAMRRSPAALRHLVWTLAVTGVLILPGVSLVLPLWNVETPGALVPGALNIQAFLPPAAAAEAPAGARQTRFDPQPPQPAASSLPPRRSPQWQFWVFLIWMAGSAAVLARYAAGAVSIAGIRRRATPVRGPDRHAIEQLTDGGSRAVVLISSELRAPVTCGILRPAVLLPESAHGWSDERRRVVLLHELTHVRRRDCLTLLLAHAVCAFYWFHPLAWTAAGQMRRLRELACDDAVLRSGARASDYAQHLLDLARSLNTSTKTRPMAAAMAEPSHLEARLIAMLNKNRNRNTVTRKTAALIALAAGIVVIPLAVVRAPAQEGGGAIQGVVRDPSGGTVPRAMVTITFARGDRKEVAYTTEAGEFRFAGLPDGSYQLQAAQPGFALFQRAVTIAGGASNPVDATLSIGRVSETVDVVAQSAGMRPPTTNPAGPPTRIRVGGAVQATKLLHRVKPIYPVEAREKGIEGTVLLNAVISTAGNLIGIQPLNSLVDPLLTEAARNAVSQWTYQPTLLNGVPVEVITTITVRFRLEP